MNCVQQFSEKTTFVTPSTKVQTPLTTSKADYKKRFLYCWWNARVIYYKLLQPDKRSMLSDTVNNWTD